MNSRTNKRSKTTAVGIHADGEYDYSKATRVELFFEEKKLQRRIEHFCYPKGIIGNLVLLLRRQRIRRKLKVRFNRSDAMFILQT